MSLSSTSSSSSSSHINQQNKHHQQQEIMLPHSSNLSVNYNHIRQPPQKEKMNLTNVNVNHNSNKRQIKCNKAKQSSNNECHTTTNLARQILNNLNIFGNKAGSSSSSSSTNVRDPTMQRSASEHNSRSRTRGESLLDADTSSMKSGRRPSVDTVSTYLSHESKDSDNRRSQTIDNSTDLLDCSIESDDVFASLNTITGSIVGVDPASDTISRFVRVVDPPKWSCPCPMCMEELRHNSQNPTISLSRCQHLMHLQCLNDLINSQQNGSQNVSYF